ncbi:GNAT family N-acetyltransferase [Streptomyces caatingaensis]|uniref:Acetyltransferase n=1 Tax=Streptomyces caatingaensis TaxID=1678637 RepID=A0A0K9X9D0_9ACTN|nr:GNAT family N-acetyltransferase [Streptomyces caatingaensis]KNB49813.1 acetyltransferase [Streptomyces caatingaensis]
MTTTLRPTAPERRAHDGARSRTYDICVNGRPVGRVLLSTDPGAKGPAGRIDRLEVDPPDRHRGRGTVAALAAEEVLRAWGCRWVEAAVPADARPALGLATALGYTEHARSLAKRLTHPPALPADDSPRPLDATAFPAWLAARQAAHAETWTARGLTPGEAAALSARVHARAFPHGHATPGPVVRVLAHRGTDVGTLWLERRGESGYVVDVHVAPEHRGRGHGRTLMLTAERETLALGLGGLALSVAAGNTPARRLHASLGYRPYAIGLSKPLL